MTNTQEAFSPSVPLMQLVQAVQRMARKHTTFDWTAFFLNMPLFLLTYGIVELSEEDKSALKTTPMPDEWLVQAAQLQSASARSLKRLQSAVTKQGFVSIDIADQFCCIEMERERQAWEARAREQAIADSTGAAVLAARIAAGDAAEPSLHDAIKQGRRYAQDLVEASAGVAAFAAEKAIWAGKGLGVLADALRDLRTSR